MAEGVGEGEGTCGEGEGVIQVEGFRLGSVEGAGEAEAEDRGEEGEGAVGGEGGGGGGFVERGDGGDLLGEGEPVEERGGTE